MSRTDLDMRMAAARRVDDVADQAPLIMAELDRVLESSAFRGSRRSCDFLRYVVQTALAGRFDELKERVIGSALFGRAPDYDTSTDAIVRVIASDARKRLQQYYRQEPQAAIVHFELGAGSYIPSIHVDEPPQALKTEEPAQQLAVKTERRWNSVLWAVIALLGVACLVLVLRDREMEARLRSYSGPPVLMPWQALFKGNRGTQIIIADTSIGGVQQLTGKLLTLNDYLSGKYISDRGKLTPAELRFIDYLMASQFTTVSYATVAARIAQMAVLHSAPVNIAFARTMSLRTFTGGENVIVLGTSRANPWCSLLEERLNFVTVYHDRREPVVLNRKPVSGEPPVYVPLNAPGARSRESYGLIGFIPYLYNQGHALLLSGTTSEGTEGAGAFFTDPARLGKFMRRMGLTSESRPQSFELLLKVRHATGTPVEIDETAWRLSP